MSNKKTRRDKGREPYVLLSQENKHIVSKVLGYPLATCEEMLATAAERGYDYIRFPRPPGAKNAR